MTYSDAIDSMFHGIAFKYIKLVSKRTLMNLCGALRDMAFFLYDWIVHSSLIHR